MTTTFRGSSLTARKLKEAAGEWANTLGSGAEGVTPRLTLIGVPKRLPRQVATVVVKLEQGPREQTLGHRVGQGALRNVNPEQRTQLIAGLELLAIGDCVTNIEPLVLAVANGYGDHCTTAHV